MAELKVEVDPAEVGLDPQRLARIDSHFRRFVDDGRLPGWLLTVSRRGQVAHVSAYGDRDKEAGLPVELDTLFRIFSMTKPVTSVAAMMLYEEGGFELKDPVHRFIPSFRDMRVYTSGSTMSPFTVPALEPMRIWHLLTHTAGLTYGFHHAHPVDAMYRAAGFEWGAPRGLDLAGCCDALAGLPLLFHPGAEWNYSVATDVLGRVVEVLAGRALDEVLAERILRPLGMTDTRWWVDEPDAARLAALYVPDPGTGAALRHDVIGNGALHPPDLLNGGAGLVSTAHDYDRFTRMLLSGGTLDGTRLLSPRTLRYMTRNHLPGGGLLSSMGRGQFSETAYDGIGFGLGFSVLVDPVAYKVPASQGEFAWGGAASTAFWVDPAEQITAAFFTQLLPSRTYSIRTELRQLVYAALAEEERAG
ncbi:MAG TPA: serine hydrolase domain-containing protein [Acidimicrobiales bacterium]|nr:serine hydrolase domain-containing protein [Acidimicrobiales bacterium]